MMSEGIRAMPSERYDLWELRAEALRVLCIIALGFAYLWEVLVTWGADSFTGQMALPVALMLVSGAAWLLSPRQPRLAVGVFAFGLAGVTLGTVWAYGMAIAPLLSTIVCLLVGVLVNHSIMFLFIALLYGSLVGIGRLRFGLSFLAPSMTYALVSLAATGIASWLSSRNLHTALQWAWHSYARARSEADRAAERQGQLNQALKSMDEASYRLQRMNYQLARARDEAEELRRLKQQFVSNVSHELRTPLALIAGFSEMMYLAPKSYGVPLPLEYQGDLREIYRSSRHLLTLVDDVLDLSLFNAGKMLLDKQEVEPEGVIQEAVDAMRPLIEGKGLALRLEIPWPLPRVPLDAGRVRQVLLNLLNNARRFTQEGEIVVRAHAQGQNLSLAVSDSGIGISAEGQARLFQEFHQLDTSLSREFAGTGLGLAISKRFVEMHGGRIWVESEGLPGKGSTFHVTLPIRGDDGQEAPGTVRTPNRPPVAPVQRLLVVGRHPRMFHFLRRHLEGYELVQVEQMEEIPEMVERLAPQAILLSPDPFEEAVQFRQIGEAMGSQQLPVILCPFGDEELLARSLGVQAYLVKPIQRGAFLQALEALGQQVQRVLIVDDDPRIVRMLTRIINSAERPYTVIRAYGGRDGLERLRSQKVDALVLDLLMPEIDGYSLLQRAREEQLLTDVPVIILTSKGYDLEDSRALAGQFMGVYYPWGIASDEALGYLRNALALVTATAAPQDVGGQETLAARVPA